MDSLLRDIRFGVRVLSRDRGFTLTALITLAACLSVNTVVFAIVHSVLLKPLPVPDADRLVLMSNQYPKLGMGFGRYSYGPDYYDRVQQVTALSEQAAFYPDSVTIEINGLPTRFDAMAATPSMFRLLKVAPTLGRSFDEMEGTIGNDQRVILSDAMWELLFGRNPDVIGRQLRVDGRSCTIVGIMPRSFQFIYPEVRAWVPIAFTDMEKTARHVGRVFFNVGRLNTGATIEQVREQAKAIDAANLDRFPEWRAGLIDTGFFTLVEPLQDLLVRDVKTTLYLFWGGAAFVLLIGAVNIANLVMARTTFRMRELATRFTLGAGRWRVARQLGVENLVLTFGASFIALLLAPWLLAALTGMGLSRLPRANEIQLDGTSALAALAAAAIVGVLMSGVSFAGIFDGNVDTVLHDETRTSTSARTRSVRRVLVIAQIALALFLLVGAGLLFASFRRILAVDPGFSAEGVVTISARLPPATYPTDGDLRSFVVRALDAARSMPGVTNLGITSSVPFDGRSIVRLAMPEHWEPESITDGAAPFVVAVTSGYLETMEISLVRGRYFDERDTEALPRVVIVDERLAGRFWPDRDPIGRRIYVPLTPADARTKADVSQFATVVGVVRNVTLEDLAGDVHQGGAFYYPYAQGPGKKFEMPRNPKLVVKSRMPPEATAGALRRAIAKLDPDVAMFEVHTMAERTSLSVTSRRGMVVLAAVFGVLALFLSAIGLYGVLAYVVAQRTREFGIRLALGATAHHILSLVVHEGILLTAIGLGLGLVGAAAMRRIIERQIYGVGPLEPTVVAGVVALLSIVGLVACLLPARRATRVDPIVVLNEL